MALFRCSGAKGIDAVINKGDNYTTYTDTNGNTGKYSSGTHQIGDVSVTFVSNGTFKFNKGVTVFDMASATTSQTTVITGTHYNADSSITITICAALIFD